MYPQKWLNLNSLPIYFVKHHFWKWKLTFIEPLYLLMETKLILRDLEPVRAVRNSKKSSWQDTGLWNRGLLKIMNGIKLILDDQGNHLNSNTIRSFRVPLFPKPVRSGTLFCKMRNFPDVQNFCLCICNIWINGLLMTIQEVLVFIYV